MATANTDMCGDGAAALINPHRAADGGRSAMPPPDDDVRQVHRALPGYAPTPLIALDALARELRLARIWVKDESKRFGLNAFKSLGASYAVFRVLQDEWERRFGPPFEPAMMRDSAAIARLRGITLCSASAGNHGRALAWMARQCGLSAVIIVPGGTAAARVEPIAAFGATVIEHPGDYDAAVARAARESAARGWTVVADFGAPGYQDIPNWIESGYSTMFLEIAEQIEAAGEPLPDVVVVQGGGGCFAAGAVRAIRHRWAAQPVIIIVEPLETASFLASARSPRGEPVMAGGSHRTICNGLNCPTPSFSSWPTLRAGMDVFMAVDDTAVERAMVRLGRPAGGDPAIVSGASGAAGAAGLIELMRAPAFEPVRRRLGLGRATRALAISTEGDTDPVHYRGVMDRAGRLAIAGRCRRIAAASGRGMKGQGMKIALHWKIIIGLVLGIVVGVILNATWGEGDEGMWAKHGVSFVEPYLKDWAVDEQGQRLPAGSDATNANVGADWFAWCAAFLVNLNNFVADLFLRCLRFIAVPIVLFSLIAGASSLNDIGKLGRIGGKTFGLYLCTTALAITIGLILANAIGPGKGVSPELREQYAARQAATTEAKIRDSEAAPTEWQTVLDMVPENPFAALADTEMLQVVFAALLIGIALTLIRAERAAPVIAFCQGMTDVVIKLVDIIMFTAPYAVFALIVRVVAPMGADILGGVMWYALSVVAGLLLMILAVYPTILRIFTPMRYVRFFRGIAPAQLLAFSSSSSGATLPVTMECAEKNLGVKEDVSSFVLPLGATVNMDGTALYQGVAAVFIAQLYGMDLTLAQQLTIVLTATLASIGTAAVPGAGIIMLVIVLEAIHVPLEGIGVILGVDRILDMCRTVVNITGDLTVATVVASTEGDLRSEEEMRRLKAGEARAGLDEHPPE